MRSSWLALTAAATGVLLPAVAPHPSATGPGRAAGGQAPPSAEIFVDVAAASGLDFVHFNGMTGELYFVEMNGSGAALFDYDNDGDLDVYLVQGGLLGAGKTVADSVFPPPGPPPWRDRLYRNDLTAGPDGRPRLRFTDVTVESGLEASGYGMGVAAGDYDNDGWTDLYLTNFGPNQMLRNNGDGTFADVTAATGTGEDRWSVPAAFFDFDRDGWLDLYVANYVDFTLETNRICPTPTGARDYCGPLSFRSEPDRLFRNLGNGRFEDVSARSGIGALEGAALGVVSGDFDGDGWLDLYVANDQMPNWLWLNQRDGTFRNEALMSGTAVDAEGIPQASMGVDAGDVDNDGDEDLFMTHLTRETNTLYRNDGTGFFEDATVSSQLGLPSWSSTGFGTGFVDYDNDGWLDILVANGAVRSIEALVQARDPYPLHQPNQLFRNLAGRRFEEVTSRAGRVFELSEVSRGAAFGDLDNDGDTDVVIANNSGPVRVLSNLVGQQAHWLGLRLVGETVARDLLGAWVGVFRPGQPTLWRRSGTDGSYASSSDPRVLVGLGSSPAIDRVEVRWPSGRVESWPGAGGDRYLTLREGSGAPVAPGEEARGPEPGGSSP